MQNQQRNKGNKPQVIGMVYAMSGTKAAGLSNFIIGSFVIVGENYCVLYDSGVTHSFVSDTFVKRLCFLVCVL